MSITDSLGAWIPQVQGQYINMDWNPQNKGFGAQCWDLAANWSAFLGLPVINTGYEGRWVGWAGNMVDAYPQTPEIAAAYSLHGPGEAGQTGDIAVWGDSYWYYPATHVAVLVSDKGPQLQCMSQNSTPARADNPYPGDSSGPTTIQSLPRQGLIGFLRPRIGGLSYQSGPITPQEDDNLDQTQFNQLVGKLDELNAAHHVATREHVNGATKKILDREPLLIDRLDVLNAAHHVATRVHVNGVRDGLLASFRATIDLLKPSADAGTVEAAEAIYREVVEKLSDVKITITAGGE